MFGLMKPGATVVSVAAMPEPQTAIRDLGGSALLSALFWFASYGIRARAASRCPLSLSLHASEWR
jgi:alcohol dehydrogenase